MKYLMECGHSSNAEDGDSKPCCVICIGIVPGATNIAKKQPSLIGRKAKCTYGGAVTDSSLDLAFFKFKPADEFDEYYCGCRGWD